MGEGGEVPVSENDITTTPKALPTTTEKAPTPAFRVLPPDYLEKEYSARTDVLHKIGFDLEARYSASTNYYKQEVELVLIKDGKPTNFRELVPEVEHIEEWDRVPNQDQSPSIDTDRKTLMYPKVVFLPAEQEDFGGAKKTASSLRESFQTRDGHVIEVHKFLALEGSLMLFAHEAGHQRRAMSGNPEEQERYQKIWEKISSPTHTLADVTEEDLQEYLHAIIREEAGAWKEGLALRRETIQAINIDVAEGRKPTDMVRTCLKVYAKDNVNAMKDALQNKPVNSNQQ